VSVIDSLRSSLAALSPEVIPEVVASLSDEEALVLWYDWRLWARAKQIMPDPARVGRWFVWLILAGRGFGKTRTGAEAVREVADSGQVERIALIGETAADVRDVMIEGPDGILAVSPPHERPVYQPSKRLLRWPNGCVAKTYSGEDPEQLRGPQHGFAWCDELAKYKYATEGWDNLTLGLRMGAWPRVVVTTTPKPITVIRELVAEWKTQQAEGRDATGGVTLTRGSTYENIENLPASFVRRVVKLYEGTTVGRQELEAELLDEDPRALWKRSEIDRLRVPFVADLVRVGVAVDPTTSEDGLRSDGRPADACGIVVGGIGGREEPHGYVLEDATVRGGPRVWADAVARVYQEYEANFVVAEGNQGGALVREVLDAAAGRAGISMPVRVVYASRGKVARAEPVHMYYEKGRVHHVGALPLLEDEMVTWLPGTKSPNRIDALVWILTELLVKGGGEVGARVF